MNKSKSKYTYAELKKALDLIEEGYSFSEVSIETNINKSIIAREMRKKKNEKARQHIKDYEESLKNKTIKNN